MTGAVGDRCEMAFEILRRMMLTQSKGLVVTRDLPGDLVVRTPVKNAKGEFGWFGTVTIKKSYVAYHLTALYERQELAADLSPELARRRQGKTCFNFKQALPAEFEELKALTVRTRQALGDFTS